MSLDAATYSLFASQLLCDDFVELLAELPDSFYRLQGAALQTAWAKIYTAVAHGERDITRLAALPYQIEPST